MVAKIKSLVYDVEGSEAMVVVIIRGTEGDTKEMIDKIRKLEV